MEANNPEFKTEVSTTDLKKFEDRSDVPVIQRERQVSAYPEFDGLSVEEMRAKFEIMKEMDEFASKKAYISALAAFKAETIHIAKDKKNSQFKNSKYSSIDATVNTAIPFLSKHGLSHNWNYGKDGTEIVVTCVLRHNLGHSESVTAQGPPDVGYAGKESGKFAKNALQAAKSTRTYLKIETFEAVTGLVSSENNLDDDGNAAGSPQPIEKITEEQIANLKAHCESYDFPADRTLQKLAETWRLSKIEDMPIIWYEKAVEKIDASAKKFSLGQDQKS